MSLCMEANGANLGGGSAHHQVTAVAALPHLDAGLLEHGLGLHVLQQGAITLLMGLFDGGNTAELVGQIVESFLIGLLYMVSYVLRTPTPLSKLRELFLLVTFMLLKSSSSVVIASSSFCCNSPSLLLS